MPVSLIKSTVDLTFHFTNRESISIVCEMSNPVVHQLCYGFANRDQNPDQSMYLEIDDDIERIINFKFSDLKKIESSAPLPDEFHEIPPLPTVNNFLHLNIDRGWIEWGLENRIGGYNMDKAFQIMHDAGHPYDDIAALLHHQPTAPLVITEHKKRESIYPLSNNCIDPDYRCKSDYIEAYEIPDFLTNRNCLKFEHLLGAAQVQTGSKSDFAADDARTGDSYIYPQTHNVPPLVRGHQQRLCDLLDTKLINAEPLRCQSYSQTMRSRTHVDYLKDLEADNSKYTSYDGVERNGQRRWTVVVYLQDGELGSGTWFSRIKKEFTPKKGTALIWNNLYPSGNPNPYTLHAGLPAGKKKKMCLAQWVRDN